jgi:hypothetical protein
VPKEGQDDAMRGLQGTRRFLDHAVPLGLQSTRVALSDSREELLMDEHKSSLLVHELERAGITDETPRKTWIAIFLSVCVCGLGLAYLGRWRPASLFFGAQMLCFLLLLVFIGFILLPFVWFANIAYTWHATRSLE